MRRRIGESQPGPRKGIKRVEGNYEWRESDSIYSPESLPGEFHSRFRFWNRKKLGSKNREEDKNVKNVKPFKSYRYRNLENQWKEAIVLH